MPPECVIDMETVYEDAVALIETLDVGPCHFVGLSMGGFVGMRLAARRPDLLRSLVLLDTSADPEPLANVPRYALLPQEEAEEKSPSFAATAGEPKKECTPRLDWAGLLRRTFALDAWVCVRCGGRRQVLAYLTAAWGVSAILEHLGLPSGPAKRAPAQGPPQLAGC